MLTTNGWILGVDLGVASVGLALVDRDGRRIVHTTARVFPAGVEGDFEGGRDESRAKKRREARLSRRQTERRKRRAAKLFHALQEGGLLPADGEAGVILEELDQELAAKYPPHPGVPYTLRALAMERRLEPHELGRALYHLGQRRGFLSNRKAAEKEDEKPGEVKAGIETLWAEMNGRTLGQYLASLDPHIKRLRGPGHYTARKMFTQEFDAIWAAQAPHHAGLTEDLRQELYGAIFFQRPLKDQSHLIGKCIYTGEPRAAAYELDAQHWRLLDKVNNLMREESAVKDVPLTQAEREAAVAALTHRKSMTYAQLAKELGWPRNSKFSIQRGGEKEIKGNVTSAAFGEALNLRWQQMERAEQEGLVRLWAESGTDEEFRAALEAKGEFTEEEIGGLLDVRLPDVRMGLSLEAMRRILPRMERGENQRVALEAEFEDKFKPVEPLEFLPPVMEVLPELRNPAVMRPLTELRKAVNELIRKYGKPDGIRIELARDLKRNRSERMELTKKNRENEAKREKAKAALRDHEPNPRRDLVEKYLLWQECGEICPYSGKSISLEMLLRSGEVEVEHIIPRSRSLDDSFANKTLCWRAFNARKGNQTPWEAFHADAEWDSMVERVRKFNHRGKLKRFTMPDTDTAVLLEQFSSNQLNDTRYMSKLALKYLGMLYGAKDGVDAAGKRRVNACAGGVTAYLRRLWDLNRILSETPEKSRDDHRHHAVDAVTVAVTDQGMVQKLAEAAGRADEAHQRFRTFEAPWEGFREQVEAQIKEHTVVSHRPERKLSGALHEETLYGRPHKEGAKNVVHIRVPVEKADVESIVDPAVRAAVEAKLREVAGELKKLESDRPMLRTKKGALIPIKKVRVKVAKSTVPLGKGARVRHVVTGDNHHMAVFTVQKRGKTTYEGEVVSRLEAMERHRKGLSVVRKDAGPDKEFLFTLSEGDMVRWKDELWRVRGVSVESAGRLGLSRAMDARLKADIARGGALERPSVNAFCSTGGRKVLVSRLGEIREAHD